MKKLVALLLSVIMMLSLCACGGKDSGKSGSNAAGGKYNNPR